MKNSKDKDQGSVIKNLAKRQIFGTINTKSISYHKTLSFIKNLKPTTGLKNNPLVGKVNNQIAEIQFHPKGNFVASVLWGNDKVHVWNLSTKKVEAFFESGHGFTVKQVRWVPGCEHLVLTSGEYGSIRLMDLNSNSSSELEKFSEETWSYSKAMKICVHKSLPSTILAGTVTGGVVNIDIRTNTSTQILKVVDDDSRPYHIDSLDINPVKFSEFCMGSSKGARVYDSRFLSNPVQKFQVKDMEDRSMKRSSNVNVEYSYDGSEILVGYSESPIYLFDVRDPRPKKMYVTKEESHWKPSRFTMFNAHYIGERSEFIAASTSVFERKRDHRNESTVQQHTLFVWDKDSEELVNEILINEASWRFAVHPYLPILAFNMDHDGVRLWE